MIRRKYISILLALAMVFAPAAALASTEGPKNGATFVDDPSNGGLTSWVNPGNAAALDSVYATAGLDSDVARNSDYLKATGFGFTLAGCTSVLGITVQIFRRVSNTSRNVTDAGVMIVKGGTPQGNDKSLTSQWFSGTYATYGSSSDQWGVVFACADITAAGFGVATSAQTSCVAPCSVLAQVDHITITVDYSTSSATDNPSGAHRRGATIFRSETRGG